MANHDITVEKGNPPTAKPYGQEIGVQDSVNWSSKDSQDWVVVFKGVSPFERLYFTPSHPKSQKVVVEAGPTKYHYNVCVDGEVNHSPWIIVK